MRRPSPATGRAVARPRVPPGRSARKARWCSRPLADHRLAARRAALLAAPAPRANAAWWRRNPDTRSSRRPHPSLFRMTPPSRGGGVSARRRGRRSRADRRRRTPRRSPLTASASMYALTELFAARRPDADHGLDPELLEHLHGARPDPAGEDDAGALLLEPERERTVLVGRRRGADLGRDGARGLVHLEDGEPVGAAEMGRETPVNRWNDDLQHERSPFVSLPADSAMLVTRCPARSVTARPVPAGTPVQGIGSPAGVSWSPRCGEDPRRAAGRARHLG